MTSGRPDLVGRSVAHFWVTHLQLFVALHARFNVRVRQKSFKPSSVLEMAKEAHKEASNAMQIAKDLGLGHSASEQQSSEDAQEP